MNFPEKITVTDQEIDLSNLSTNQKEYYIFLAQKLVELYSKNKKERFVVSLSGPSGSGKSVTAEILRNLISDSSSNFKFYKADLDAFHFSNEYLEKALLKEVKGRYDTYDTNALSNILKKFTSGGTITFPMYSRKFHNPIENGFSVNEDKAFLFIVGLWFLRNDEKWESIWKFISYNFYLEGPQERIKENTIKRHILGGREEKDAKDFYDQSDLVNTEEILSNSILPDETIQYFEDIS